MKEIPICEKLEALAERCEEATGRDTLLDLDISHATGAWKRWPTFKEFSPTASIDAALTLVPAAAWWSVMRTPCADGYDAEVANDDHRHAATPALALCAAALRARATPRSEHKGSIR